MENNECEDIGNCDCLYDVVFYPSMEKGFNMCYWPICSKLESNENMIKKIKLWFDTWAGRTYSGARR